MNNIKRVLVPFSFLILVVLYKSYKAVVYTKHPYLIFTYLTTIYSLLWFFILNPLLNIWIARICINKELSLKLQQDFIVLLKIRIIKFVALLFVIFTLYDTEILKHYSNKINKEEVAKAADKLDSKFINAFYDALEKQKTKSKKKEQGNEAEAK